MKCPFCSSDKTKVTDKRASSPIKIRRRRECLKCRQRFTTYERIELRPLMVIKKDGRREPFNREKLKAGLLRACEKRSISIEAIDRIVDDIEARLRSLNKSEVKTTKIGKIVLAKLKKLDEVAYIRFASVYQEFGDLKSFENAIKLTKR